MILRVAIFDSDSDCKFDVVRVTPCQFSSAEYHPYILSKDWDKIIIDLDSEIKKGLLPFLTTKTNIIPVFDCKSITSKAASLLAEIVPDKAAFIRKAYMSSTKEELLNEVKDISAKRNWAMILKGFDPTIITDWLEV